MANHFKELKVWQKAMELVTTIYQITADFPNDEKFGLISQIRRCAVSIPSNIAEGACRDTTKDFLRFISIAYGSLGELETQLLIAKNLNFINKEILLPLENTMTEIGKMLNGLGKSLKEKLTTDHSLLTTPI